jgi:hypothetical protein
MAATSTRSRPLTGDRLLGLPHPRNWSSQVQQISHIGVAASHSPNDNQVAPVGGSRVPEGMCAL